MEGKRMNLDRMEQLEEQAAHRSAAAHGRLWEALNSARRKARAVQGIERVVTSERSEA